MRLQTLVALGALLSTTLLQADTALTSFDAATVKASQAGTGGNRILMSSETLTMSNVTLNICLKFAYDVQDIQIAGPASLATDRYDIVAKAPAPVSNQSQFKPMLQSLLAERFHLSMHREIRDLNTFALVVAKGGPKFHQSAGTGTPMLTGKGTVVAQWAPMKMLADFLAGPMHTRVTDMTGLEGQYDFKLDLTAYAPADVPPGQEPDVAGMVLSGLQDELGLKLEPRRTPTEVLVVDHVEKPNEN